MKRTSPGALAAFALVAAGSLSLGCSGGDAEPSGAGGSAPAAEPEFGDDRPVSVRVPSGYDAASPAPLVILLHGFGASGFLQDVIFRISTTADAKGYFFAAPDGTVDEDGSRFWNATDACCNFHGSDVDDVAYLTKLVHDIEAAYSIDPKRIYFVGHSNGGFMSHRLACDAATDVAAIVSVAGAVYADPAKCNPAQPVAVLQIHGTNDGSVAYEGSSGVISQPGALATVTTWAGKNGCGAAPTELPGSLDLEGSIAGTETDVTRFEGCEPGGAAELWTIPGGTHVPNFVPEFPDLVWDFFAAHPKP